MIDCQRLQLDVAEHRDKSSAVLDPVLLHPRRHLGPALVDVRGNGACDGLRAELLPTPGWVGPTVSELSYPFLLEFAGLAQVGHTQRLAMPLAIHDHIYPIFPAPLPQTNRRGSLRRGRAIRAVRATGFDEAHNVLLRVPHSTAETHEARALVLDPPRAERCDRQSKACRDFVFGQSLHVSVRHEVMDSVIQGTQGELTRWSCTATGYRNP
ncbi:MAG TPA: hypothetical protein VN700_07780 [Vicinamibacterales bacterium]|nr:hypothetical protein [Vicinamibacterales bacterium]